MYVIGQGLFGKIKFVDGQYPGYDRAYLIVFVCSNKIGTLNVSSVAGKEHKLLLRTNKEITKYNPPFYKKSFVKLDSLTYISIQNAQHMHLMDNGRTLDRAELKCIINAIL